MDNKRLLLATLICFGLLMGWQYFAQFMGWIPEPVPVAHVEENVNQSGALAPDGTDILAAPAVVVPRFAPTEGREVRVDTPLYSAVFHSGGGVLQSFTLKNYADNIGTDAPRLNMISPAAAAVSPMGLLLNGQPTWNMGQWAFEGEDLRLSEGQSGYLIFSGEMHGIRIERTITFHADTYLMDESIHLVTDATPTLARLGYTLAVDALNGSSSYDVMAMAWYVDGKFSTETSQKKLTAEGMQKSGEMNWAGVMSNYFLAAIVPPQNSAAMFKARVLDGGIWRTAVETQDLSLAPGVPATTTTSWWMGPKDRELLKAAPNSLDASVDMGMFKILALPLLWLLRFFYSVVGNWGIAIILLTVLIKMMFWPLSRKSYKSMEKMKKIQPMMAALQQKHGKDKEALSREMMQLYKTYGVNPMGGCLPILVQLPFFVALYQALLHSIELRHAAFITYVPFTDMLWLADLSVKDPFYITPLIMGATMFLQQWMSPAVGDPTQRKMMMLMPVIFTVMFINFPSGLVLYWLCNNVLSIAQQWWTLRKA